MEFNPPVAWVEAPFWGFQGFGGFGERSVFAKVWVVDHVLG